MSGPRCLACGTGDSPQWYRHAGALACAVCAPSGCPREDCPESSAPGAWPEDRWRLRQIVAASELILDVLRMRGDVAAVPPIELLTALPSWARELAGDAWALLQKERLVTAFPGPLTGLSMDGRLLMSRREHAGEGRP